MITVAEAVSYVSDSVRCNDSGNVVVSVVVAVTIRVTIVYSLAVVVGMVSLG